MSVVGIDPQQAGVVDDGTEQGHVRVAMARAGLVDTPLAHILPTLAYGGSGSIATNYKDIAGKISSCGSCVVVTTGAGTDRYASVRFAFGGKRLGLHFEVDSWTDLANMTVFIDGQPYNPTVNPLDWKAGTNYHYDDVSLRLIVADDLEDGPHQCEIHFAGNALARTYTIYSIMQEADTGRPAWPLCATACGTYAFINATPVALNTMLTRNTGLKFLSKVMITNSTAAAIVCSATYNSVAVWSASVGAYSTAEFAPGLPMPQTSLTAATALTFTGAAGLTALVLGMS